MLCPPEKKQSFKVNRVTNNYLGQIVLTISGMSSFKVYITEFFFLPSNILFLRHEERYTFFQYSFLNNLSKRRVTLLNPF